MQTTKQNLMRFTRKGWPYVVFLLMALLVIFPQIHHRIFIAGLDSYFHMSRFYEDAMQIKTGHFSYFQSLFSFQQTGRIVNAFYGPWFSYIMGWLLLITDSWLRFQVVFSIFAIFLSAVFMYRLLRDNRVETVYSILIALIYSLTFPVRILIFKQEFTGMGAVFFPLVVLLGTRMIRERRIRWVALGVTMAVIFQIHLLTGLISGLIIFPFAVYGLIKTKAQKRFLTGIAKALVLFIGLTANLWGAILEVALSSHLVPTFPQTDLTDPIDAVALNRSSRYVLLTPLDLKILMGVLILIIVGWYWMTGLTRLVSVMSIVAFWLSSAYFPWNAIVRKIPALANLIQFPKRFLPLVPVLSLFTLGLIISRLNFKSMISSRCFKVIVSMGLLAVLGASVINVRQTMSFVASRWNRPRVLNFSNLIAHRYPPRSMRKSLTGSHWNGNAFIKVIPDYLPTSLRVINAKNYGNLYEKTRNQLDNENPNYHKRVMTDGNLKITWRNQDRHWSNFKLPVVKYGHTQVNLNHDRLPNRRIHVTSVGAMIVNSRPGINQMQISYHSCVWFKILMIINVIAWLLIIALGLCKRVFK